MSGKFSILHLLFIITVITSCLTVEARYSLGFVKSYDELVERGVVNTSPGDLVFANEDLKAIASQLHTPKSNSYSTCHAVGTSEELFNSELGGNAIDAADIVVRGGIYYPYLISTTATKNGSVVTNTDTPAGRRYDILGTKMDVMFIYPHDMEWTYEIMGESWRSQNTLLVTFLSDISWARTLLSFLQTNNINETSIRIALLTKEIIDGLFDELSAANAPKDSFPTPAMYAATVCKSLTRKRPVKLYGGFMPYTWVPDYVDSSKCDPTSTEVRSNYIEWDTILAADNEVELMDSNFHGRLLHKSANMLIPPRPPAGSQCPMDALYRQLKDHYHYERCAIVGAAPWLGCMHLGKEIDGHDAVFRMNAHLPIQKQVDHMGSKTTHIVFQNPIYVQPLIASGCSQLAELPIGDSILCNNSRAIEKLRDKYGLLSKTDITYTKLSSGHIRHSLIQLLAENAGTSKSCLSDALTKIFTTGTNSMLTTGFTTMYYALQTCKKIDVYGFSAGPLHMSGHSFLIELAIMRGLQHECGLERFNVILPSEQYEHFIDSWLLLPTYYFPRQWQ